MAHVFDILPDGRLRLVYPTQSIPWQLKTWWDKDPGHQQTSAQEWCRLGSIMWFPTVLCWCNCDKLNTLRPRQNVRQFADDIFKCIFFNENIWISINISLTLVHRTNINKVNPVYPPPPPPPPSNFVGGGGVKQYSSIGLDDLAPTRRQAII